MSEQDSAVASPDSSPEAPAPRRRWGRIIIRVVGVLAIILVLALVGIRIALPGIIRSQIESVGSQMLGRQVTVDEVTLSVLGGKAAIKGVTIQAPDGFDAKEILTLGEAGANVSLSSLLSNQIVVEDIHVAGLHTSLEVTKDGKQSLRSLFTLAEERMKEAAEKKRKEKGESKEEEPEESGEGEAAPGKGILIKSIRVDDVALEVHDAFAAPEPIETSLKLSKLAMRGIVYPAPASGSAVSVLEVQGFSLASTKPFSEPDCVSVGDFAIHYDLGKILATMDKPVIDIPSIDLSNTIIAAESLTADDDSGQNFAWVGTAISNATSLEDPVKVPQKQAEEEPGMKEKTTELASGLKGSISSLAGKVKKNATEVLTEEKPKESAEPAPEEELPIKELLIQNLQVNGLTLIQSVDSTGHKTTAQVVTTGSNIRYPQGDHTDGVLKSEITGVTGDQKWGVKSEATGALADNTMTGPLQAATTISTFPLAAISPDMSGELAFNSDLALKDGILNGKFKVSLTKVKAAGSHSELAEAASQFSGVDLPEIQVKNLKVKELSPAELVAYLTRQLIVASLNSATEIELPSDLKGSLEDVGAGAAAKLEAAGNLTGGAAKTANDTAKEAQKEVEEAAGWLGSKIGGAVGKDKKDEK